MTTEIKIENMENKGKKKEERQSNLELCRIFAMFLIIFHHFSVHGGFNQQHQIPSISDLWLYFIIIGGKIGVNLFVLISGYFLIVKRDTNMKKHFKKLIPLQCQITFQGLTIGLLMHMLDTHNPVPQTYFINFILPITHRTFQFGSVYFLLYLLHPFINIGVLNLSKITYQKLLVIITTIQFAIPTFTFKEMSGNEFIWFVTIYLIGGYIRIHVDLNSIIKEKCFFYSIGFTILTWIISSIILTFRNIGKIVSINVMHFYEMNSLFILLISVFTFLYFLKLEIPENKQINKIAATTFGVYLIHDHVDFGKILQFGIFKNAEQQESLQLIPYSIFVVCTVFIFCSILEMIRQRYFENGYVKLVSIVVEKIQNMIPKLIIKC